MKRISYPMIEAPFRAISLRDQPSAIFHFALPPPPLTHPYTPSTLSPDTIAPHRSYSRSWHALYPSYQILAPRTCTILRVDVSSSKRIALRCYSWDRGRSGCFFPVLPHLGLRFVPNSDGGNKKHATSGHGQAPRRGQVLSFLRQLLLLSKQLSGTKRYKGCVVPADGTPRTDHDILIGHIDHRIMYNLSTNHLDYVQSRSFSCRYDIYIYLCCAAHICQQ